MLSGPHPGAWPGFFVSRAVNRTTRHVDVKNQPAEEVLRQAVYLRSSLGRKASLQVRWRHRRHGCPSACRSPCAAQLPMKEPAPTVLQFGCVAPFHAVPCMLLLSCCCRPATTACTRSSQPLAVPPGWLAAGEAPHAHPDAQHPGALDARAAGCTEAGLGRSAPGSDGPGSQHAAPMPARVLVRATKPLVQPSMIIWVITSQAGSLPQRFSKGYCLPDGGWVRQA